MARTRIRQKADGHSEMDIRMSSSGNNRQIRRILSIDGGGIKGTMPAAFLAGLEDDLGDRKSTRLNSSHQ